MIAAAESHPVGVVGSQYMIPQVGQDVTGDGRSDDRVVGLKPRGGVASRSDHRRGRLAVGHEREAVLLEADERKYQQVDIIGIQGGYAFEDVGCKPIVVVEEEQQAARAGDQ